MHHHMHRHITVLGSFDGECDPRTRTMMTLNFKIMRSGDAKVYPIQITAAADGFDNGDWPHILEAIAMRAKHAPREFFAK